MNKLFDRILNLVALLAVATMTIPLSLILLDGTFPHSALILPVFSIGFTVIGYVFQHSTAKFANKRASRDGFGSFSDGILGGFSIKYAGVPLTASFILCIISTLVYNGIMDSICQAGIIKYYSAVYAVMFFAVIMICCTVGCIIWFYPIERLANIYILLAGCIIFLIEFGFVILTSRSNASMLFLSLAFAVYLICMMIVFSQSSILQKYHGSVVSVLTPSARMYNLFLVFMLFLILIAITVIAYIMLSGLFLIGRILFYLLMYKMFYNVVNPEMKYDPYAVVDAEESAQMFKNTVMNQDERILLSYFFAGILTFAAIIVCIKTGVLQKFWAAFKAWIAEFFSTIFIGMDIFKNSFDPNSEDNIYNYKDEKKKLQNAGIGDYKAMADSTDTYKLFMQRLGRLKTYDEQLCYSYAVLLKVYKKMNLSLKRSDTPREIRDKVERALVSNEIEKITSDFESVRYALDEKSDTEAVQIITNICNTIKRYMF